MHNQHNLTSCWQCSKIDVGVVSPPRLATACLDADMFWQYAEYSDLIVWQFVMKTFATLAGLVPHRSNSGYNVELWKSWISSENRNIWLLYQKEPGLDLNSSI